MRYWIERAHPNCIALFVVGLQLGCSDPAPSESDTGTQTADSGAEEVDLADLDALEEDAIAPNDGTEDGDDESDADLGVADPWAELQGRGPTIHEMIGLSTHMRQSAGEDSKRDFEFETYDQLGGVRIRQDYHWHRIEPNDDEWHLEAVQTQVDMAREHDVQIDALLAYGVDWAMEEIGIEDTLDVAEYAEYAGHVAGELCDDVKAYEIWNEENIVRFWDPAPNPELYGDLLKAGYTAVKDACPDAVVLLGGLSSYDLRRPFERWWFLDEVHEAHPDIGEYFDVLGLHPYTFLQYPAPEQDDIRSEAFLMEGQSLMTAMARQLLIDMDAEETPIWYTEIGWPSYELSEEQVGRFLPRSLLLAARDGVEAWFWYTFWDSDPITTGVRPHEHYFGLFGWAGEDGLERREKPAFRALRAVVDLLGTARFARDASSAWGLPNDVYALLFIDEDDTVVVALWDGRDFPDRLPGRDDPGGPDTTQELTLSLPEGALGAVLYDLEGVEQDRFEGETPIQLVLTPAVQYLVLN